MLAALPISRSNRFAIKTPAVPDAPRIGVVDGIVAGLIGLTVLALVAPSLALAALVAGAVIGALVLAGRVATAAPIAEEADRIAVALAMKANYSFNR